MGQTLSEPVVEKNSDAGQDDRVAYGVSAMQGWRISMEDAHAAVLDLTPEHASTPPAEVPADEDRLSFFGVYDGHGGDKVAIFAGQNVHKIIVNQDAFKRKDYEQALKDGFLATDRAILSDPKYEEEVSGCTATVALISGTKIHVANAGDSRTVLGIKGRAKPLSFDHKPQNEGEKARICAAGGFVDFGRVNGNLALSRALGDFEFKKSADLSPEQQIVTAFPDVLTHEITDEDEFFVLACDGIWDCQSSQSVVEFVRRGIVAKQSLDKICENMMDNCLAANSETGGVGCDNMTMVVVALLRGKTQDEWYQEIADRVEKNDGPVAPPEFAEMRGPGARRRYDESGDDFELDMDQRTRSMGGRSGRIILLGDGNNEASGDSEDHEMMDDDDHDMEAQGGHSLSGAFEDDEATARSEREGTPGPENVKSNATPSLLEATSHPKAPTSPTVPDTTIPEKLDTSGAPANVNPSTTKPAAESEKTTR